MVAATILKPQCVHHTPGREKCRDDDDGEGCLRQWAAPSKSSSISGNECPVKVLDDSSS